MVLGIVGTGIGAWEFWYQHQYAPSLGGHTVALTAKLGSPYVFDGSAPNEIVWLALPILNVCGTLVAAR